jgi:hypothetical protein
MSKKWKIFMVVVAAVVVLALSGGAIALANGGEQTSTSNPLFAKVATILGITEEQLTNAFKQAQTQNENETIANWLAKAVENKTITPAESEAIKNWLAQRPANATKDELKIWLDKKPQLANSEALKGFLQVPSRIRQLGYCIRMQGIASGDILKKVAAILGTVTEQQLRDAFQQAGNEMRTAAFDKALTNAVTNGKITQAESEQIKAWWAQKPAALDKLSPGTGPGTQGWGIGRMLQGKARLGGVFCPNCPR